MKILIGVVAHQGEKHCRKRFLRALNALGEHDTVIAALDEDTKKSFKEFKVISAAKPSEGRELLAKKAKDHDALLLLEGDIIMPANTIDSLSSVDALIVGGAYLDYVTWQETTKIAPVVFAFGDEPDVFLPATLEAVLPSDVVQAAAVGFGCCLIRKEALNLGLENPLEFAKKAQEKKMAIGVDCRIKCVHAKHDKDLDWPMGLLSDGYSMNMSDYTGNI